GVATGVHPTATFSRAMDPATITSTSWTLKKPDGTAVAASVAYDSATTATLTPAAVLDPSVTYTAALDTTVKAADGFALASAVTWAFTTQDATRINAGGGAYTTSAGKSFLSDSFVSGGQTNAVSSDISGTTDPALYQNERWGQFSYAIPVPNG